MQAALASEIGEIGTSAKRLRQAMAHVAILSIAHPDLDLGFALSTLKALKEPIKLEKLELAQEKLAELELMTGDEAEEFAAWQAMKTPPGLAPGQGAKAPDDVGPGQGTSVVGSASG